MTVSQRRPTDPARRTLDSPWVAAALAAIVLLLAGVLIVPGLLGGSTPGATSSPGAAGTPPVSASPTPFPTFARPTPSPAASFTSYVVRAGDTLNSIAKKFHTTARSIAWWNRGAYPSLDPDGVSYDPSTIRVGWMLVVLPGVVVDDSNPPTPSPAPEAPGDTPAAS